MTRRRMHDESRAASSRPSPALDIEFADDAYSGGDVLDILASFKAEITPSNKYDLYHEISKCTLYLLAGEQFRGNVAEF